MVPADVHSRMLYVESRRRELRRAAAPLPRSGSLDSRPLTTRARRAAAARLRQAAPVPVPAPALCGCGRPGDTAC